MHFPLSFVDGVAHGAAQIAPAVRREIDKCVHITFRHNESCLSSDSQVSSLLIIYALKSGEKFSLALTNTVPPRFSEMRQQTTR